MRVQVCYRLDYVFKLQLRDLRADLALKAKLFSLKILCYQDNVSLVYESPGTGPVDILDNEGLNILDDAREAHDSLRYLYALKRDRFVFHNLEKV